MKDSTSKNSGGIITVRTRNVHAVVAMLAVLAAGASLTGCGNGGSSPLDTVRALDGSPPDPTPSGKSPRPTGTSDETPAPPPSSPDASDTGPATTSPYRPTSDPTATATGATGVFVNDPCRMMTLAEAKSLTGLPIATVAIDADLSDEISSFCDYSDTSGSSLVTVMVMTRDKSFYDAEEAAKNSIENSDNPVAAPGVGDAAFTYRDDGSNGIVWAKDLPGDRYLAVDVYIDRHDKDVPASVLASIARTMIGRL